jgi:Protein of Unknown function (DUF2784)
MSASFAADALVLLHAAFIVFALFGGLLAWRRRGWMWLHLPAAAWAATVVIMGWICPLTPWEQRLRAAAGQQGYSGGFIEHYVLAAIYPEGLTRTVQIALGAGVIAFNLLVYLLVWRRAASAPRRAARGSGTAAG